MLGPELNALTILCRVKRYAAATLIFTKSVTHGCDWLHGTLIVDILGLDRYDTVVVVNICIWVLSSHCRVFLLNLRL